MCIEDGNRIWIKNIDSLPLGSMSFIFSLIPTYSTLTLYVISVDPFLQQLFTSLIPVRYVMEERNERLAIVEQLSGGDI